MEYNFCGIVFEVSYPKLENTAHVDILGKKMGEWVRIALDGRPSVFLKYREEIEIPLLCRPYVKKETEYTVVLFSDTPLITKKTVCDAITTLIQNNLNVLKLTRGWVFRSEFLLNVDKVYSERTYYFDEEDFITVFNHKQLAMARNFLKNRILDFYMEEGVNFEDTASTFIGPDVSIGKNVFIGANNHITGTTKIEDNVYLGSNNVIKNCKIDRGAIVKNSEIEDSYIGQGTTVGPYSYVRAYSIIGDNCRIGDFVEVKNSKIMDNSKLAHLTYAGDCDIGKNCNIGCGVVFANYNGEKKQKTIVGDDVFIGSNANLIAPLVIGDGAFVAAGSTIDDDIPGEALAIARKRQENILNWKNNPYTKNKSNEQLS